MYIRLLRDWHSYRKGSVLELPDTEALDLIVEHKAMRAREGDYMRNLGSPPMDKMVRKADRDK